MRQPSHRMFEFDSGHQLTLPMQMAGPAGDLSALMVGSWAAGERVVDIGGRPLPANVWFHFALTGEASLSMRYCDQNCSSATAGIWSVEEDGQLVARFGQTVIRSTVIVEQDGDVVYWAGEVLSRLPTGLPAVQQNQRDADDGSEPFVPNMRRTDVFR